MIESKNGSFKIINLVFLYNARWGIGKNKEETTRRDVEESKGI